MVEPARSTRAAPDRGSRAPLRLVPPLAEPAPAGRRSARRVRVLGPVVRAVAVAVPLAVFAIGAVVGAFLALQGIFHWSDLWPALWLGVVVGAYTGVTFGLDRAREDGAIHRGAPPETFESGRRHRPLSDRRLP